MRHGQSEDRELKASGAYLLVGQRHIDMTSCPRQSIAPTAYPEARPLALPNSLVSSSSGR